ncbi:Zinc ABC transporter, inner membrane permease protein ZnuB [Clostridiaceae bacterium JG1575]|nr:Zinc ABC transporter, inner membrane permease protein ZnuB [Clostridiaceae bacterium JG1575]
MLSYDFMRNALSAGFLVAILCPVVGTFLVLRRFSMMGDTLSHSAFAGVTLGLFLGINPSFASLFYTVASAVLIEWLRNRFKSYQEVVMAIVMTFNVGLAILIASRGRTAGVNSFLFGSILTVEFKDLVLIAVVTFLCLCFIRLFYDQLLYVTFDEEGARISGIKVPLMNYLFTILAGAAVGVSIRITGLLVISSILVLPVAAAMNLHQGFRRTLFLSVLFGLIAVLTGLVLSYHADSAPGGTIALVSVACLLVSFLLRKR